MDYNAWFEVFLDGRWFTFDARHNTPRIAASPSPAARRDGYPARYVVWPSHIEDIPGLDDEVDAAALQDLNRRSA